MVGIEQVKGVLRFVVQFGSERELWSGRKVRKYCIPPADDADATDSTNNVNGDGKGSNGSAISGGGTGYFNAPNGNDDESYPPVLPSGYDYDDYDAVCGLARGNSGWGSPQCFLPPAISDTHSIAAKQRSMADPFFDLNRGTATVLFLCLFCALFVLFFVHFLCLFNALSVPFFVPFLCPFCAFFMPFFIPFLCPCCAPVDPLMAAESSLSLVTSLLP